jgi:hypothetical protein
MSIEKTKMGRGWDWVMGKIKTKKKMKKDLISARHGDVQTRKES